MAQVIRFDPDPEGDGDLGTAHFDDGTSLYTSQAMIPPELKGALMQESAVGPNAFAGPGAGPAIPPIDVTEGRDAAVAGMPNQAITRPQVPGGGMALAPGDPRQVAFDAQLADYNAAEQLHTNRLYAEQQARLGQTGAPLPPGTPRPSPPPGSPAAIDAQIAAAQANPVISSNKGLPGPGNPPGAPAPGGAAGAPGQPALPSLGHLGPGGQQSQPAPGQPLDPALAAMLTRGTYSPGVNPQAMLQNGVMVPTNERVTTDAGVPYNTAEAQVRELANQKVVEAHIATAEAQAARAQTQKAAADAALPALQRQAAANQARYDTMNANYQRERAQLQFEIDDFDRTAKVDPDRYFAERGAWGTIGAIIGQALGAYAATLSGTPNWAQEAVNKAIDRDIMAQQATLSQKRMGQKNALARLADRYGDVDQAAAALKLSQQQIADKQILSFAAETGRDDIMNAAREWVASNQQQRVQEELALYHASIGKQQQVQEARFTQPSAGGPVNPTTDELLKRVKLAKELGWSPNGGGQGNPPQIMPPDPSNPLWVSGINNVGGGYARHAGESDKMREKRADFVQAMMALDRLEGFLHDPRRLIGVGDRSGGKIYNLAHQAQADWENKAAKAFGGVMTEPDVVRAVKGAPDITSTDILGGEDARLNGTRQLLMNSWESLSSSTLTPYQPKAPLRAGEGREHQDE